MLDPEILKKAEKIFSIPLKTEITPEKYDAQKGVKSFLVSAKDISLETSFSGLTEIDDLKSIKLLVVSAYKMAPSRELKVAISKAGACLDKCIKLILKKQSSRFKYTISEAVIKVSHSEYLSALSYAIDIITTNQAKADLTFYKKLREGAKAKNSLPYRMDSAIEEYKADIIIYSSKPPQTTFKKVEYGCYIIEGTVIAVNTDRYKGTKIQTQRLKEEIFKTYKATIHGDPIFRNSQNIKFFLLLDFGISIHNACFIDYLIVSDIQAMPDTYSKSLDHAIAIKYNTEKTIENSIRKQKALRLAFEKENQSLVDSIQYYQNIITDLRYQVEESSRNFRKWCSYLDDPFRGKGLAISDFNKVDSYFRRWLYKEITNEERLETRLFVRKNLFRLKVKASIEFFHYRKLKKELEKHNNRLKFLLDHKNDSMKNFALKNGIISQKDMLNEEQMDVQ